MKAAIYARVSTIEQATVGSGLDTQLEQCRRHTDAAGWTVVDEFVDGGVSGSRTSRPELDRLLAIAHHGEIDVIVFAKLDRFGRSLTHLSSLFDELDTLGITVVSVGEAFDSSTTTGRLMRNLLAAFAEFERDRITERMTEGHRRTVIEGGWRGGPAPFGYQLQREGNHTHLVPNHDQQHQLRIVYDLVVNRGLSVYAAAQQLNATGYRTARGRPWRHENLSYRLRQPYLTGTWTTHLGDEELTLNLDPAIFTPEEWAALQAAINSRRQPRQQSEHHLYPLTGRGRQHLFCPCGGAFQGMWRKERNRGYYTCGYNHHTWGDQRCSYTPRTYRSADLDTAVMDQVVAALTDPDYLRSLAATQLAALQEPAGNPLPALRRRLSTLGDEKKQVIRQLARDSTLHSDTLTEALADIAAEQHDIEAQIQHLEALDGFHSHLAGAPDRITALVDTARDRLQNPTPELMADLFDLLQLELHRTEDGQTFEGAASIPIPDEDTTDLLALAGEVDEKGPQPP